MPKPKADVGGASDRPSTDADVLSAAAAAAVAAADDDDNDGGGGGASGGGAAAPTTLVSTGLPLEDDVKPDWKVKKKRRNSLHGSNFMNCNDVSLKKESTSTESLAIFN